ncbi:MAG: hypothetical protein QOH82_3570 [Mycobacterium sp.]|nr:hypothetical protein [Mycobacterium sp.]
MSTRLLKLPLQIGASALSVLGVRVGTEEPPHSVKKLADGVELRTYQTRIAAETTVTASQEGARRTGFRRLAAYIFGANHRDTRIDMTAPVAQQKSGSTQIAMTAPVAQSAGPGDDWIIRFYMPSKWTMGDLPAPDDDRVRLVNVPPEKVAVLRFSGNRDAQAVASRTEQLRNTLSAYGFDAIGETVAWFYDPPWTLSFLRRNEVAVPVS